MQKRLAILGSTGSIGTQALDVVAAHNDKYSVYALVANSNDRLLEAQIEKFKPEIAVLLDVGAADSLKSRYSGPAEILAGEDGLLAAATHDNVDMVLTAMVGFAGLAPTLAAIEAGKDIALANKETMVAAGELVTKLAAEKGVAILPVDSEHSAVFQCLNGENRGSIKKIILTASGGPFRTYTKKQLEKVTLEDCLKHPNWTMGKKITIDSASLVNKGLEVIEAKWLFDIEYDKIDVVVHPQSIVHSMVEFVDGAVMAQLGKPDMRVPIQYAFSFPDRLKSDCQSLDLTAMSGLTFFKPDHEVFPSLSLAYSAGKTGGTMPCIFNAANEAAVNAFLRGSITFLDIFLIIEQTMKYHQVINRPTLTDILTADEWARSYAAELIKDAK